MLNILFLGTCPECGCHDIREDGFYRRCFKCGYSESCENNVIQKWGGG